MTAERTDLYAVLGLPPEATQEQIRRAYHTLLRQNHPDSRPLGDPADSAASDTTTRQAIYAYAVLGDPIRRAGYDQHITARRTSTGTPLHPAPRFTHRSPEQPPIQAGPVRWHHDR
jgi:DnaJ-class molecular chaperone